MLYLCSLGLVQTTEPIIVTMIIDYDNDNDDIKIYNNDNNAIALPTFSWLGTEPMLGVTVIATHWNLKIILFINIIVLRIYLKYIYFKYIQPYC